MVKQSNTGDAKEATKNSPAGEKRAKARKRSAKNQMKKTVVGSTYYPEVELSMKHRLRDSFDNPKNKRNSAAGQKEAHKKLKEQAFKAGLPAKEILKLDNEFKARFKRAKKTVQKDLGNRRGMSEYRKKSKGKASDTGSEYKKGGRVGFKSGGIALRGRGCEIK